MHVFEIIPFFRGLGRSWHTYISALPGDRWRDVWEMGEVAVVEVVVVEVVTLVSAESGLSPVGVSCVPSLVVVVSCSKQRVLVLT